MEIAVYLLIFIIGTLFGSFFSLAVYRIPIKQSIMHGRSYCPKCNHKLGFLDLIPVLSYIFLGGKCRYCKNKIRGRYICLEILSGITFLLFAISLNFNFDIYSIQVDKLIYLVLGLLFISTLFIIGGIEKENYYISNSVLLFGFIIETIYIIYLYVLNLNIYKYAMYLFFILILFIINIIALKKRGKEKYWIQILILCLYIVIFIREELVIISIIFTLLLIAIKQMKLKKENSKKTTKKSNNIPIGFYLCFLNIIMVVLENYLF